MVLLNIVDKSNDCKQQQHSLVSHQITVNHTELAARQVSS